MPRIKLIANPFSDRGRTAQLGETLQQLLRDRAQIETQKGIQYDLDWALTEHPLHATELAHKAGLDGYDMVVALGGDGTVHEVINGLMKVEPLRRPALGIVPVGTGNDFAYNLNIPMQVKEAVHCLFGDKKRPVDVLMITDGAGRREYWNNTVNIGFGGAVNIDARHLKGLHGFLLYFVAVIRTILFKPPALLAKIQIDDQPVFERDISMFCICNGAREGGGFPVAPNAVLDDGLITYVIMRKMGRLKMFYFVPIIMTATHLRYKNDIQEGVAKRIRIETDTTMAIHTDGEIFGSWEADVRQIETTIIPAAIQVVYNC